MQSFALYLFKKFVSPSVSVNMETTSGSDHIEIMVQSGHVQVSISFATFWIALIILAQGIDFFIFIYLFI
jgi:hypothetical protein